MEKTFRPYNPAQNYLFPRSLDEYVEGDDLSIFIRDLVRLRKQIVDPVGVPQWASPTFPPFSAASVLSWGGAWSSVKAIRSAEFSESLYGS